MCGVDDTPFLVVAAAKLVRDPRRGQAHLQAAVASPPAAARIMKFGKQLEKVMDISDPEWGATLLLLLPPPTHYPTNRSLAHTLSIRRAHA